MAQLEAEPAPDILAISQLRSPEAVHDLAFAMEEPHGFRHYWAEFMEAGQLDVLGAYVNGEVAGCMLVDWSGSEHQEAIEAVGLIPFFTDLNVNPAYRRRGVGATLVEGGIDFVSEVASSQPVVGLEVDYGNIAAQALYRKLGFQSHQFGDNEFFVARGYEYYNGFLQPFWTKAQLMTRQVRPVVAISSAPEEA